MPGPIKPKDVASSKTASIPEEVFEAFNELITQNWNGHSANILLRTATDLVVTKLKMNARFMDLSRQEIYDRGWMDVEDSYRKAGWKVEFDKPGYNENYEANYSFFKK